MHHRHKHAQPSIHQLTRTTYITLKRKSETKSLKNVLMLNKSYDDDDDDDSKRLGLHRIFCVHLYLLPPTEDFFV